MFEPHIIPLGNGLDNRRENLRCCTLSQNSANRKKPARPTKFPYKGVYASRGKDGLFGARITVKGTRVFLGVHKTVEGAARAYDRAAKKRFGKFAALNFPVVA